MALRLRRPSEATLAAILERDRSGPSTVAAVGLTAMSVAPLGYRMDRWSRALGTGDDVFTEAAEALTHWRVHRRAGLIVRDEGPATVGSVVAMSAPLPIGFVDVVCRVLAVEDGPECAGFVYGTLANHPVAGVESFHVRREPHGTVTFHIVAVSRPRHVLARCCPAVARRLQRTGVSRYLDAMQSIVAH